MGTFNISYFNKSNVKKMNKKFHIVCPQIQVQNLIFKIEANRYNF